MYQSFNIPYSEGPEDPKLIGQKYILLKDEDPNTFKRRHKSHQLTFKESEELANKALTRGYKNAKKMVME